MYKYEWLCVFAVVSISFAKCPTSKNDWDMRATTFTCGTGKSYHCLKNENNFTEEKCFRKFYIEKTECPLLKNDTMIYEPCEKEGCPDSPFFTNKLYLYPVCWDRNVFETYPTNDSTSPNSKYSSELSTSTFTRDYNSAGTYTEENKPKSKPLYIILGGALAFIVLLNIFLITFYCFRKRRRRQQKTIVDKPQAASFAVMSRTYDDTNINPANSMSTTGTSGNIDTNIYNISENEDIYNHLQTRRVKLDQPILYDSD